MTAKKGINLSTAEDLSTYENLLTTSDVAAITRAPLSTVRYWRYCGTGPRSFRIGRRVMYRSDDVSRWLAERHNAPS